jgi:hypothetical protein
MPLFHAVVIMVPTALLFESDSKLVATLTFTKDFPPLSTVTIDDINGQ